MKNPSRQYACLLTDLRQRTEQAASAWEKDALEAQELGVQNTINRSLCASRRALEVVSKFGPAVVFLEEKTTSLLNEKHPTTEGDLFALTEAADLIESYIAEYKALVASVDPLGQCGLLLERCLTTTRCMLERTRRLIRNAAETKLQRRSKTTALAA